jgi:hypothetical protein
MRTTWAILFGVAALSVVGSASADPFFTDDFIYDNGALTTVSAGNWVNHSGTAAQMQVLDQEAVVVLANGAGSSEDVNRAAGSTLAAGATWYYGATFTVEDTRATPGTGTISNQYLMHFKDSGTFNFRGRLYLTAGSTPATFTLGVTSSSGTFNPGPAGTIVGTKWGQDLTFGQEYTVVVSYQASLNDPVEMIPNPLDPPNTMPNPFFTGPLQPGDGYASLWVNPATVSSTKVTDTNPPGNVGTDLQTGMSALALRQGGNGPARFDVDIVSIGSNFDEVLAAVAPATPTDDADFDGDGDVDGEDFLTWQRGVGAAGTGTLATGDANGDLDIDGDDLAVWEAQFGVPAVPAVGAVPEPACLALAAMGMVAAAAVGRRRGC